MINWLNDDECMKGIQDSVLYVQIKKRKMSPQDCSKCLRKIMNEVRIDQQYGGAIVRHAMITKLRKYGATQERVNAFTRYTPGSNVVDVYYNKPVGRDLSTLLLSGGDFRYPLVQVETQSLRLGKCNIEEAEALRRCIVVAEGQKALGECK
ncbi:MAG: hypothetical protein EZS28_039351 [Streblomastix strix]|uniref:Uncharacterized protein n=1 Tax=Streblomastix strix TaxID=222440 RepID=A0A5J4U582_9EUKA|nr:MAG: hypothetical protein EZS28_039351 [Streblomastix strix]